jgi:predicted transcriptional regulator
MGEYKNVPWQDPGKEGTRKEARRGVLDSIAALGAARLEWSRVSFDFLGTGRNAMRAEKRPGKRTLYIEVPEELGDRLDTLLKETRRTITAEVTLALELWLERQGVGESAVEETPAATREADKPRREKKK